MKKLLIGFFALTSLASFAQSNNSDNELCVGKAYEEIMNTETVNAKLVQLLSDNEFKEVNKISLQVGALATLACNK